MMRWSVGRVWMHQYFRFSLAALLPITASKQKKYWLHVLKLNQATAFESTGRLVWLRDHIEKAAQKLTRGRARTFPQPQKDIHGGLTLLLTGCRVSMSASAMLLLLLLLLLYTARSSRQPAAQGVFLAGIGRNPSRRMENALTDALG